MPVHPLGTLNVTEVNIVRDVVLESHSEAVVSFREIFLQEPPKAELLKFLDSEHTGRLRPESSRPARLARAQYDVIGTDKIPASHESVVDVQERKRISHEVLEAENHASLTGAEFLVLLDVCAKSTLFKQHLAEFELPERFEVIIEPWPYGGPDKNEENRRYFQGLCFAQDTRSGNRDSNYYAYPLPLIPVLDYYKKEIIRVDKLATGGKQDGLNDITYSKGVIDHCRSSEYIPELYSGGIREDLKALNVVQPDGPSFQVKDDSLIEWQKWRFRVGFTPREGATIHDVQYNGRSVLYRLSVSEMTVPYADPRPPFQRKQAFDFGDGGAGHCANSLELGCDCLGVIKYLDAVFCGPDGKGIVHKNVVCVHEQDSGICWKHTSWRTGRAVVTRNRELVIQFIITLANYEYVFAYKFDLAGNIMVETRATGIVSVVNIDPGKTSYYGNVVSPGVLAQNHQHIFALRIDPAIDGQHNTVVQEESHTVPISIGRNPKGNMYEVRQNLIRKSQSFDAEPKHNRVVKIQNASKTNKVSGKPVAYKFTPSPSQLLLADPNGVQSKRAQFAQHHVWVTKYKDNELYAGGRYTLQSQQEIGGLADAIARNDNVEDTDVVVWNVFGLTHNPRVEDWPVMPAETHQLLISPSDFFEGNPAIDVPSTRNMTSEPAKGCHGKAGTPRL